MISWETNGKKCDKSKLAWLLGFFHVYLQVIEQTKEASNFKQVQKEEGFVAKLRNYITQPKRVF